MKPDNATVTKFLEQLFPDHAVSTEKSGRRQQWRLTSKAEPQSAMAVLCRERHQFVSLINYGIEGQRNFDEDLTGLLQVVSKYKPAWLGQMGKNEAYYRAERERAAFIVGLAKEFNMDESMSDRRFAVHGQHGFVRLSEEPTVQTVGLEIELSQLGPQDVRDIVACLQPYIKACVSAVVNDVVE